MRYWGQHEVAFGHTATNGVNVSFIFERAGIDSGLTVAFTHDDSKYVFFLPLILTKPRSRRTEIPKEIFLQENLKELTEAFVEALHQTHAVYREQHRREAQYIEGAPLHNQPEWDEVSLLQVAVERLGDRINDLDAVALNSPNGFSVLSRLRGRIGGLVRQHEFGNNLPAVGEGISPSRNV